MELPLSTRNRLENSGFSKEEQKIIYDTQLQDIIENPSWYLNNLNYMKVYRVFWKCYINGVKKGSERLGTPTLPYNFKE